MKKLLLVFMLLAAGSAGPCLAQDLIRARTGIEFKAKVLEITPQHVFYRAVENRAAPILVAPREEITWIRFRNGTYDHLNPDPLQYRPISSRKP